jgi:DNA helicase-2/ATP-dependent DNA helicase PcrA
VVNYPARGIGETTLDKLVAHALGRGWSLWQAIERVDALDDVTTAARDGCRALTQIVSDARRALGTRRPASEVVRGLCERISLKADLDASAPSLDAAARRWANVEGVLATLARREAREGGGGMDGLSAFVHTLTMDIETDAEDPGDAVTLSTLHGSKGLEFDVVFLVGCEEGYLPHARTLDSRASDPSAGPEGGAADLEEERRLFYVGVTRARERLVLSRARTRVTRGRAVPRTASRFLLDVPAELLEEIQVTDEAPTTMKEATANAEAILAMLAGAKG